MIVILLYELFGFVKKKLYLCSENEKEPIKLTIKMLGISTPREPIKGEFAKKIKASVAKMKQQLASTSNVAKSTSERKYTVIIRG